MSRVLFVVSSLLAAVLLTVPANPEAGNARHSGASEAPPAPVTRIGNTQRSAN